MTNLQTNLSFSLSKDEELWMEKLTKLIINNLSNPDLNNDFLAKKMNLSSRTLHYKLKRFCHTTPAKYVKNIRLNQAHHLLESNPNMKISDVTYFVGFKNPTYFSKQFKQYFGYPPSHFRHLS